MGLPAVSGEGAGVSLTCAVRRIDGGRLRIVSQRFSESTDKNFGIAVQPLESSTDRSGVAMLGLSGFVYEVDRASDFSVTDRIEDRGP